MTTQGILFSFKNALTQRNAVNGLDFLAGLNNGFKHC